MYRKIDITGDGFIEVVLINLNLRLYKLIDIIWYMIDNQTKYLYH